MPAPVNESLLKYLSIGSQIARNKSIDKYFTSSIDENISEKNNHTEIINATTDNNDSYTIDKVVLAVKDVKGAKEFYHQLFNNFDGNTGVDIIGFKNGASLCEADSSYSRLAHFSVVFENVQQLASALLRVMYHFPERYMGSADNNFSTGFYVEDYENNVVELSCKNDYAHYSEILVSHKDVDPHEFVHAFCDPLVDEQWGSYVVKIGHVHLQSFSIKKMLPFYCDVLGFNVSTELPSVVFFTSSNVFQQFAVNTWNTRGKPIRASRGLYEVVLRTDHKEHKSAVESKIRQSEYTYWNDHNGELIIKDPVGTRLRIL